MNILEEIKKLSLNNKKTLEQIGLKLSEETRECSQALLSYVNANGSEYKKLNLEDVKAECIDVILVALSLFYKLDNKGEDILNILDAAVKKWKEEANL